jgi:hypothetical protein
VSNDRVRSNALRIGLYCVLGLLVLVVAAAIGAYSITRHEARTAYQVMADAAELRVGSSTFTDVLAFGRKHDGDATGSRQAGRCVESDCLVSVMVSKDDFWDRHPKLARIADRIVKRGWSFIVFVWIEDGKMSAIEQVFGFSRGKDNLVVITDISPPQLRLYNNPSYRLHSSFAVYPGPNHFNVWISPNATQERAMLHLDFDCVLRLSGCKGVSDMAPRAWTAYQTEQRDR